MIYHIVPNAMWEQASSEAEYAPPSLADEGFVHCSARDQVLGVANSHYRGEPNLVLLELDDAAIGDAVVWEDSYGLGEEFPHLYRALRPDDVVRVIEFPTRADGSFELPESV